MMQNERSGTSPIAARIELDFASAWSLNDYAHRAEHFSAVNETANYINDSLDLKQDKHLILLSAYFHDLFSWSRHNHHELSAVYCLTTDYHLFQQLTPEQRQLVSDGCRYHRASGKEPFPNVFAELMCAADREMPGKIGDMLWRARRFRYFREPYSPEEEILKASIEHLKEKFGVGGYARYPDMYTKVFEKELEQQRQEIMELSLDNYQKYSATI